ncbi:hypothetical protein [Arenibaculum pallidiluteum]|uniref:hypothetical protein n=1 Tax=Arenibaculum pallidiluteum TaxID=2812559 RepID=UPI001A978B8B|nr:hypothetical protein [Arenibaculum pallidiluteum]
MTAERIKEYETLYQYAISDQIEPLRLAQMLLDREFAAYCRLRRNGLRGIRLAA